MGKIPQNIIDQINETADIVDIVSQRVDLQKRGKDYFGLCPFHSEKTPSFSVAPDKGIFHCFGCGKGGNSINFLMEYEKIDFMDAVMDLANQLGININIHKSEGSDDFFSSLYDIHQKAAMFYRQNLNSDLGIQAKQYLLDRGINEAFLKKFKIGFALPDQPKGLFNYIKNFNYGNDIIKKCGLFGFSEQNTYDRFRSRIIFPIANSSGKIIAFSGRAFGNNDHAKYLNSPETPIYKKSEVFYGLNLTRESIIREKYSIIVEGYTDLIQLCQSEIFNVIAVSGTAFNIKHVNNLRRFTSKVYLSYDGDTAGQNAALKAGYLLIKEGIDAKIVEIPNKLDPDEWVKKEGKETFLSKGIDKALDIVPFHIKISKFNQKSSFEKSRITKEILSKIKIIQDPIIRQECLYSLSSLTGIEEKNLNSIKLKNINTNYENKENSHESTFHEVKTLSDKAEFGLIKVLFNQNKDARKLISENLEDIALEGSNFYIIISKLLDIQPLSPSNVIDRFDNEVDKQTILNALRGNSEIYDDIKMTKDYIHTIKKIKIQKKINNLRLILKKNETNDDKLIEILTEMNDLRDKLSEDYS